MKYRRRWARLLASAVFTLLGVIATRRTPSLWWVVALFACATLSQSFPQLGQELRRAVERLAARVGRHRHQRKLAARAVNDAELRVSDEGVTFPKELGAPVVPWSEIVEVELYWEESSCGFAGGSDVFWRFTTNGSRMHSVEDSEVNRFVLLPALTRYLPQYAFVYRPPHSSELKGSMVCWKRPD